MSTKSTGERLSDIAYRTIRDRIVRLDYEPLVVLNDRALAEDIGVGVQPVRDAIKRLEFEHLVTVFPRRGTFVSELGIRDVRMIDEMRVPLEGLAAELAAVRATADERALLVELTERNRTNSGQQAIEEDTAIHRLVYSMSHNQFLEQSLNQNLNLALRVWYYSAREDNLPLDEIGPDQTAMAYAIRDSDPKAARAAAEQHVTHNSHGLLSALGVTPSSARI